MSSHTVCDMGFSCMATMGSPCCVRHIWSVTARALNHGVSSIISFMESTADGLMITDPRLPMTDSEHVFYPCNLMNNLISAFSIIS